MICKKYPPARPFSKKVVEDNQTIIFLGLMMKNKLKWKVRLFHINNSNDSVYLFLNHNHICDRPPQTSRKVGIFYFEIQGKIHGKVVFWRNWDFNGFEMFISFLKLLAKYQLSFLLQNIWKLTFSRCSCTGNVYKMKTLRHVFSVLRILTCHASKNRNSTSGCRMNSKQLSIQSWRYVLSESAIK